MFSMDKHKNLEKPVVTMDILALCHVKLQQEIQGNNVQYALESAETNTILFATILYTTLFIALSASQVSV